MPVTDCGPPHWQHAADGFEFQWDIRRDHAQLRRSPLNILIWEGSLLPLFWLKSADGKTHCLKAVASNGKSAPDADAFTLHLKFGNLGDGELEVSLLPCGVRFSKLTVHWTTNPPPAMIAMHFGAALLTKEQTTVVPSLDLPFWPDWSADGFCIPSAKGAPIQSFFRRWDFGHATIPLGNFGPSLGTPYAAAYPRPLLAAAMGNDSGWLAIGPGALPDAALSLQLKSSSASLQWLYREDLWNSLGSCRQWDEPLRFCWAGRAIDAYQRLFQTFDVPRPTSQSHQRSSINSWGSFKTGDFDLRRIADHATNDFGASVLVIDDLWESFNGSGQPALDRFPQFDVDLEYARSKGLNLGFWTSVGWVDDPSAVGLTNDDLLCGADGVPRKANWAMNPHSHGLLHFCLDPAAPKAKEFLRNRTRQMMRRHHPALIKLDFAYGLPGPDVAVSRNPELRGERMGYELIRLIVEAAREINPDVTIQYYGIHPLMSFVTDIVALDDLGDAGNCEAAGHAQWSIWSTLLGAAGTAIMASSGYHWDVDEEILLNTAVIGAPGCVLPLNVDTVHAMSPARLHHRRALSQWHRRTTRWNPLWLDSDPGSLTAEPNLACWGRLESFDGHQQLTALALRMTPLRQSPPLEWGIDGWNGRWALIAQDDRAIHKSHGLACIPLDGGSISLILEHRNARVFAITPDGRHPADEASVDGLKIRIEVPAARFPQILGYLIEKS